MPRHRYERTKPLLPPRKRNWTPGTHQLGLFVRTNEGSVIEIVLDTATEAQAQTMLNAWMTVLAQLQRMPDERVHQPEQTAEIRDAPELLRLAVAGKRVDEGTGERERDGPDGDQHD